MKPISIIQVVENIDDTYGGPAKSIPSLMKELSRFKFDQCLLSCNKKGYLENELVKKFHLNNMIVPQYGLSALRYAPDFKNTLSQLIKKNDQSIIHIHNLWNYIPYAAWQVRKQYHCPMIISPRGSLFPWSLANGRLRKKFAMQFFQRNMIASADCIHVTSEDEYQAIRKLGFKNPITVISNGLDLSEFERMPTRKKSCLELGLKNDSKHLLFMSRIDRKKGLDLLIHAFSQVQFNSGKWKLLIAGPISDSNYWAECMSLIKKLNLENDVKYLGMVRGEVRLQTLAASDIFALTSYSENFGVSILEALASKLPVLTTTNTPWQEINNDHAGVITGTNVLEIASGLKKIINQTDQQFEETRMAAKNISSRYSAVSVAEKMADVYKYLLGKGAAPNCMRFD